METITAELQKTEVIGSREKLAAYFELTKPRIAFMLVLTAAAGFYLGGGAGFDPALFVHSMIAIALLAFGVATLNQYIERDVDMLMERTANRPLPSGRLAPVEALIFGTVLCLTAEIYFYAAVNTLTAILGLSVIIGYVFLYTPLKTRTTASTAIGAIPGAMPPLMGWTAASNEITLGAWGLFLMLFLWQFPHFLAIATMYKEQYAKAGIKMLPVVDKDGKFTALQIIVFTILLIPVSLAPFFIGISGIYYLIGATLLGGWLFYVSVQTARAKSKETSRRLLLTSVLYLPVIYALMVFNH